MRVRGPTVPGLAVGGKAGATARGEGRNSLFGEDRAARPHPVARSNVPCVSGALHAARNVPSPAAGEGGRAPRGRVGACPAGPPRCYECAPGRAILRAVIGCLLGQSDLGQDISR